MNDTARFCRKLKIQKIPKIPTNVTKILSIFRQQNNRIRFQMLCSYLEKLL